MITHTRSIWTRIGLARAGVLLFLAWPVYAAGATLVESGQTLAAAGLSGVPACTSCHGTKGEGMAAAGFPYLAGQGAGYLESQLLSLANGDRPSPIMAPIAKGLDAGQIKALAAYYSQLPPAFDKRALASHVDSYPAAGDTGAWLANRGDWGNNLPACIQCHGPGGVGAGADFPALAGQPAAYLQAQLMAWKTGQRKPGPQGLMGGIAGRMDQQQIAAAARYFAQLPQALAGTLVSSTNKNDAVQSAADIAGTSGKAPPDGSPPDGSLSRAFAPSPADSIPDDEFGKVVRQGQDIFLRTGEHAGRFVGNSLNCVSCHLDAGRRKDASPMWAAYVMYPAYRAKNARVNTLAERLQGCFAYSMNGAMPSADSGIIVALESYMYWMAKGAPTGAKLEGQGFKHLPAPVQAPDYVRGEKVFQSNCVLCHGADGAGQKVEGKMVFPALWGDDSYNWGAGMQSIPTAAAFIKANMPLGGMNALTDQEAWDVAYYMNAHERPQDPRYGGSLAETQKKFHDAKTDLYGQSVNGHILGSAAPPPGGSLRKQSSRPKSGFKTAG